MNKIAPSKKQMQFLDWEFGAFFHFGIRTFYPGHRDWDGIEMPAEAFCPDEFDCRQWVKTVKEVGAKYAVMTTKHHDGFALWPSAYTAYSVAASPWRGGKGDVVKEFTEACRAENIACGLYYSPAQWGATAVRFENETEYDDYFIHQISELLTNYGKIDYLWFDGCGSGDHEYDQKRIIGVIRTLQPDITIFGMWDPDTMWVGNEDGYAPIANTGLIHTKVLGEEKDGYFPYECDCRLRGHWFCDRDVDTLKSVEELVGMYEYSVGRGANLLLNIGPDERGLLPEPDIARLREWRAELDRRYGSPLPFGEMKREDNRYSISYTDEQLDEIWGDTDRIPLASSVILREDISEGVAVRRFRLYAHIPSRHPISDRMICVWQGETIGHKCIIRFPAMRTPKLTLEILESDGDYQIDEFKAYS
ncbi:MAG: alpha-L-fucosidase [Ruminococcus sp.]|nr:alpha-L-fucosidase [Candidatus Apopatosoma intestinale]